MCPDNVSQLALKKLMANIWRHVVTELSQLKDASCLQKKVSNDKE